MKKLPLLVLCASLLILSCAGQPAGESLAGRAYLLKEADGQPVSFKVTLAFSANDSGLLISGAVCNRFSGQARLENNLLLAPVLASTKMFCFQNELNLLENNIFRMLGAGAELTLQDENLILRQGEHQLVYAQEP